jgi:hypothetical protein
MAGRRIVFDPLIDGTIQRKAGGSEMDLAVSLKDAGYLEAPVLGPVDGAIARSVEAAATGRLSAKEKNEQFFAAQAVAKQAARPAGRRAGLVDEAVEQPPAVPVSDSPFVGKSR